MMSEASLLARADRTGLPLLIVRLSVGGLFVWMALVKIADPFAFLKLMRQYDLFDEQSAYVLLNLTAVLLPWLELVCGAALILGVAVRAAGLLSGGLLLAFTPMIFKRGLELFHAGAADTFCGVVFDCGCGAGEVNLCFKLLENCLLLMACVVAVASRSRRFCLGAVWDRHQRADRPTCTT